MISWLNKLVFSQIKYMIILVFIDDQRLKSELFLVLRKFFYSILNWGWHFPPLRLSACTLARAKITNRKILLERIPLCWLHRIWIYQLLTAIYIFRHSDYTFLHHLSQSLLTSINKIIILKFLRINVYS